MCFDNWGVAGGVGGCAGMLGLPPMKVTSGGHFATHGAGSSPTL